jgi:hypothetical protein
LRPTSAAGLPATNGTPTPFERALLQYGDPQWTSVPSSPERGTAAYAQETKTVDREQRYAMYLRRSFVWHSEGRQLARRLWVKVDVPEKDRDLAQKVVNDIFTQSPRARPDWHLKALDLSGRSRDRPAVARSRLRPFHSPHEWGDFSHRLHEAGHQPYCLVWP